MQLWIERSISLALAALLCSVLGCSGQRMGLRAGGWLGSEPAALSPAAAAQAELARGDALESAGDEACVDAYFRACRHAWESQCAQSCPTEPDVCESYNKALTCLLLAAQRFHRFDPVRGLALNESGGQIVVPIAHFGFAWSACDFQRLHPPPVGREALLSRRYCFPGIGAPLAVDRCRDDANPIEARFLPPKSSFAATALLRFDAEAPLLEFHNPVASLNDRGATHSPPLAADLSAPLAQMLEEAPRTYFAGFIEPGGTATAMRLNMLEPYQPGKTPVVLIHGLFSDPLSWADMVNDLRATPGFAERYQIWFFRYPTGQGFLQSAAALRRELAAVSLALDPECRDPALRRMILIGHSMGGLIAKLQVTHSDELVWSRLANRPLDEIVTTEEARTLLAENCYFDPSPQVARVIFIATPHGGSLRSSGLVGRGAALLVEPSPEQAAVHDQLVRDNPGAFNPEFEDRLPTSVDMLAPRSPLLAAMHDMRFGPGVRLHNIVGVSHPVSLDGPSDGIVSARSAWHPCCQSVLAVGAPHAKVHRARATSEEIWRILEPAAAGEACRR